MRISAEAEASYALLVSYRPLLHGNYFCSENLGNGLLCVQQKMGATLLKMAERFAGNSTAAAVAIIAAQVFLVRKWSSILVICIWIFIVLSCVEIKILRRIRAESSRRLH